MCSTHKYNGDQLLNKCLKKKAKYQSLVQNFLPSHVFIRFIDGQTEQVPDSKLEAVCEMVAHYHDMLRADL